MDRKNRHGLFHTVLRWGLGLVVMWAVTSPAMASDNYHVAPYTFSAKDYDTAKIYDFSFPDARQAVDAAIKFLEEHDKPADVGQGKPSCHILVYSSPRFGSYTVINHLDGGSSVHSDCNDYIFTDEITVVPTNVAYDVGRNAGSCDCGDGTGTDTKPGPGSVLKRDPVNIATGNKFSQETDYVAPDGLLSFRRFYNSVVGGSLLPNSLGTGWRHSFERELEALDANGGNPTTVQTHRPDGRSSQFTFSTSDHAWHTDVGIQDVLTSTNDANGHPVAFTLTLAASQQVESYFGDGRWNQTSDLRTGQVLYRTTYSDASTPATVAPKPNLLIEVTDINGRSLHFAYDAQAHLASITAPDGSTVAYGFDSPTAPLSSVTYAGGATTRFIYNEAGQNGGVDRPWLMTGVIDARNVRYETTAYDSRGRVVSMVNAGGAGSFGVAYGSNTTITGPLGGVGTLIVTQLYGEMQILGAASPCGPMCNQPWKNTIYDANGNPQERYDFSQKSNSVRTVFDAHNLLTSQIDAYGNPEQRTTDITWDVVARVPLTRTIKTKSGTLMASQGWAYNARHQMTASCDIDPAVTTSYVCGSQMNAPAGVRQTRYTYCDAIDATQCPRVGLMLSIDGPRIDVSDLLTFSYYLVDDESGCGVMGGACHRAGDLKSTTDALGHISSILAYDKAGRIARRQDIKGVLTDLAYTDRGWLASRTIRARADGTASSDDAITRMDYDVLGQLHQVTDPDGVVVTYGYDDAHRLIDVADASGSHLHYTLDAADHRIKEQILDSQGAVTWSVSREYNPLEQLIRIKDGKGQVVFDASAADAYDDNGHLVNYVGTNGTPRSDTYDALYRLATHVEDVKGTNIATADTTVTISRDVLDRPTDVTDPDGLVTTYGFDGLSNPVTQVSPDTGSQSATFDAAGNPLTQTDAKGTVVSLTYDALGRKTAASYADSSLNVAYHYDEADSVTGCKGSFPAGTLTRVVEASVTTTYCYDRQGRVTEQRQTLGAITDTTDYVYTRAGRLAAIASPSGLVTEYGRNTLGQIVSVTVTPATGTATKVVTGATYLPFGPLASYALGNGQVVSRTYDTNYQVTDVTSPALNLHFARDTAGSITALGDAAGATPATETYVYDPLYRLTSVNDASGKAIEAYTYNRTGDRLSKTAPGLATGAYGYKSGSHWLISIGTASRTYDANGSTTANASAGTAWGYGYNGRGELTVLQQGGSAVATYAYNSMGQRVAKTVGTNTTRFAYGPGGLLGEYGVNARDYVWLDDVPVGVVDPNSTVYVHADALNTPRVATANTGASVWNWAYKSNPFGESSPTSTNGYVLNLRFPGQYFDTESGAVYNRYRYYDPASARYLQSDPIGHKAGPSTYGYAGQRPLGITDPYGLVGGPPERAVEIIPESIPEVVERVEELDREEREEAKEEAIRAQTGLYATPPNPFARDLQLGECPRPGARETVGPPGVDGGVYALVDGQGEIMYWGRTNDFKRRGGEHSRSPDKMSLLMTPVYRTYDYNLQRGIEQTMMEQSPAPLNQRNSISPSNPMKGELMQNAQEFIRSNP